MKDADNLDPHTDWLTFVETVEGFEQADGLFSTSTDARTIIHALNCLAAAEAQKLLTLSDVAFLLGKIAAAACLPVDLLHDDFRTVRRVLSLSQSDDLAVQLAQLLLSETFGYGCLIRHERDGALLKFDDGRWIEITTVRLKQALADLCLANPNLAPAYKPKTIKQAVEYVTTITLRERSIGDLAATDGPILNVCNGELWMQGCAIELRPHRPWSGQMSVTDIFYDPGQKSPTYDGAVAEIFANATNPGLMIRHWHEFAGYAIQPGRFVPSFWLLIGRGANGKSKLLDIVRKLVGSDAVLAEPIVRFQTDKFALSSLAGKKLLIDDDVDEDLILSDGLIKKLSEEKAVTARSPYGRKKKPFVSIALPIMAGNHYPTTKDISPGMQRRTFVIPFERMFGTDEQDPKLFEHIWQNERSGVLNHFLAGLLRIVKRGFKFEEPQDCVAARSEFFVESNPLRAFIAERCQVDTECKTRISDIRAVFRQWAQDNAVSASSLGGNKLKRNLQLLGFEVTKMKGYPYVRGLKLKPIE